MYNAPPLPLFALFPVKLQPVILELLAVNTIAPPLPEAELFDILALFNLQLAALSEIPLPVFKSATMLSYLGREDGTKQSCLSV